MKTLSVSAPAKVNLTLDILGRRPDGYHELRTVMQSVSLSDTVTLSACATPGLSLTADLDFLPGADKNIAAVAARAFAAHTGVSLDGLHIDLVKRIPVCAGTAGGSSDAAAVLRGLNEWFQTDLSPAELQQIGAEVGSDVPFCVTGGTALAEGRGERLTPLPPLPDCFFVLCKPYFSVSTPELYEKLDRVKLRCHPDTAGVQAALERGDLVGVCRRMFNVMEQVLPDRRREEVEEIQNTFLEAGALGTCMSGTGPTVFGIFDREDRAKAAFAVLRQDRKDTFLAVNR